MESGGSGYPVVSALLDSVAPGEVPRGTATSLPGDEEEVEEGGPTSGRGAAAGPPSPFSSQSNRRAELEKEKLLAHDSRLVIHAVGDAAAPVVSAAGGGGGGAGSQSGGALLMRRQETQASSGRGRERGAGDMAMEPADVELSEGGQWSYDGGMYSPQEKHDIDSSNRFNARTQPSPSSSSASAGSSGGEEEGSDAEDGKAMEELLRRLGAVQRWADSYRRAFAPAYPPFEHALGVVNPLSGENNAAALVERGMLAELGAERVVLLDGKTFSDPSALRRKMKEQAFFYQDPPSTVTAALMATLQDRKRHHQQRQPGAPVAREGGGKYVDVDGDSPKGRSGRGRVRGMAEAIAKGRNGSSTDVNHGKDRGTVIIAGGDGTVSFIMNQVHLARREIEAELRQLLKPHIPLSLGESRSDPAHALHVDVAEATSRTSSSSSMREGRAQQADSTSRFAHLLDVTNYYTMPAVAPIPMGTGNDYSNCVGFGSGFTYYRGFGFCCCCESDVGQLLHELVDAPSVPFDRWTADFVPLRVAQENLKPVPAPSGDAQGRHVDVPAQHTRPLEPNMANTVHHVDWQRIHATRGGCVSYTITNYLGVGFDAYVTTQFAQARKSYPALCSSRMQNKALYGVFGVRGGVQCRTIRNLLPMVCVPSSWPASTTRDARCRTTALSHGKADMVALQLPSSCKALVMTNVSRYSSGKEPWKPKEGELYYRPVELSYREEVARSRNSDDNNETSPFASASTPAFPAASTGEAMDFNPTNIAGASLAASFPMPAGRAAIGEGQIVPARTAAHRPPIITPVAINDRKFELQAMGGVLSYATLSLGLHGATKMTQTGEMFVFALCTPDDLRYERAGGLSSPFSRNKIAKYQEQLSTNARVQASLNVQIDGEAVPRITEPTVIHVYPMAPDRIYVRCRNPAVVRTTAADEAVSVSIA